VLCVCEASAHASSEESAHASSEESAHGQTDKKRLSEDYPNIFNYVKEVYQVFCRECVTDLILIISSRMWSGLDLILIIFITEVVWVRFDLDHITDVGHSDKFP
jgi:hypothetical protein